MYLFSERNEKMKHMQIQYKFLLSSIADLLSSDTEFNNVKDCSCSAKIYSYIIKILINSARC